MKKSQSHLDNKFMKMALDKAYEHLGSTKENPSVGCIVVKNNAVISSGTTSLPFTIKLRLKKQYGDFHIVAGSFRIKENSYTKLAQLKSIGYIDARKIGQNNYGLYQVSYGSYDTRAEAYNALNKIRSDHNINAWLLYKNVD